MAISPIIVLKIGTSSLTNVATGNLALATLGSLVETVHTLRGLNYKVVLVSSGAVGVGCSRLGLKERPKRMAEKQAIAAVGQGRLMRVYDDLFSSLQQPIAQVLLTRRDLVDRNSYVHIQNTFEALLARGIVPIVNENDTVATDELKFGDNDTLSALVASLIGAQWLFLLTDVDRLYTADPRQSEDAQPIDLVAIEELQQLNISTASTGSRWGTGGMATKIAAAKIATNAGVRTVITHGRKPPKIIDIVQGKNVTATQFAPQLEPDSARKRWIAFGLVPQGKLYLDEGAVQALSNRDKSLLPAGIIEVEGQFNPGDSVQLCDRQGHQIGRGLVKYNHQDLTQVKGCHSDRVESILGQERPATVVHRDDLVLLY